MNNLCAFYATLTPWLSNKLCNMYAGKALGKNMLITQQVSCIKPQVYDLFTNFLGTFYEE